MRKKLIVLIGTSLAGKSTFSEKYVRENPNSIIVSRDKERKGLYGIEGFISESDEEMITYLVDDKIKRFLEFQKTVILDNTHLNITYIDSIVKTFSPITDIEFKIFDLLDIGTLSLRNQFRFEETGKLIPLNILKRQITDYESLSLSKYFSDYDLSVSKNYTLRQSDDIRIKYSKIDTSKDESVYLCDIDNTIAIKNNRSILNYTDDELLTDLPNEPVIDIIKNIMKTKQVIFITGRSENYRQSTIEWLMNNGIDTKSSLLYMRKDGDMRKEYIVKYDILRKDIQPNYNVIGVFDDRNRSNEMWLKNNIFVFDVSLGLGSY